MFHSIKVVSLMVLLSSYLLANEAIKIGFMPYLSSSVLLKKYTPLAHYLSLKTGEDYKIVIAKDYSTHLKNCGEEKIDICFLGGSPYVLINKKYKKKPILAGFEFNNHGTFRSVIFVKKDSPIKDLQDLRNKKVAFGSVNSTLSTHLPLFMLINSGLDLNSFKYAHLRNHENVYYGVLYEDFDAGAVAEEVFSELRGENIKALKYSQKVATHLFVSKSTMDKTLFKKIQNAFISLEDKKLLKEINPNLTGFFQAKESDYSYHKKMLEVIAPLLGIE